MRSIPRAGLACALVAVVNALAWAIIIPPFHVPDENAHVAYAQYLAETGKLPQQKIPERLLGSRYSDEEAQTLAALRFYDAIGDSANRPIWFKRQERDLERVERSKPSRVGAGNAESASNNPPLYYGLTAVPYLASPSKSLLDRLFLMRLVSVLLAGATTLLAYLFVRELLPGSPWAAAVGGLAVALQPLFGFMSGGVTNDALLYTAGAAILYTVARAFRRGLTPRHGAAIGAAVGLGLVAKPSVVGLVPGVALGLLFLVLRGDARGRREPLLGAGVATLVALAPVLLYVVLSASVWDRPLWGPGPPADHPVEAPRTADFLERLNYGWQLYLPRLPFVEDLFPGEFPPWETWFRGFIGRFGWLDYGFPAAVYHWALAVCGVLLALAGAALVRTREVLRRRLPELVCYAVMSAGVLALIAAAGYNTYLAHGRFEQARYLLPLLGLYGVIVALGVRGAGRRWGPAAGAAVVVLSIAHSVFAQLLTIARYYG